MIGMRTLKTSLAIFIALIVSDVFKLQYPFFTVIAIIVVMQNTINETYQMGINRILGTALGGLAGILYIGFIASEYWILDRILIGVITLFIILILIKLKATKAISISLIVFLSICINDIKQGAVFYAFLRILDTMVGIVIALVINAFVAPPDHAKKFVDLLKQILSDEKSIFINKLNHNGEVDLNVLSKSLEAAHETLKKYRHDSKWVPYNEEGLTRKEELLQSIFHSLSEIYHHLVIIEDLNLRGNLSEETLSRLSSFDASTYQEIYEEYFEEEMKVIYNYHVYKILDHFEVVEQKFKDYDGPAFEK